MHVEVQLQHRPKDEVEPDDYDVDISIDSDVYEEGIEVHGSNPGPPDPGERIPKLLSAHSGSVPVPNLPFDIFTKRVKHV